MSSWTLAIVVTLTICVFCVVISIKLELERSRREKYAKLNPATHRPKVKSKEQKNEIPDVEAPRHSLNRLLESYTSELFEGKMCCSDLVKVGLVNEGELHLLVDHPDRSPFAVLLPHPVLAWCMVDVGGFSNYVERPSMGTLPEKQGLLRRAVLEHGAQGVRARWSRAITVAKYLEDNGPLPPGHIRALIRTLLPQVKATLTEGVTPNLSPEAIACCVNEEGLEAVMLPFVLSRDGEAHNDDEGESPDETGVALFELAALIYEMATRRPPGEDLCSEELDHTGLPDRLISWIRSSLDSHTSERPSLSSFSEAIELWQKTPFKPKGRLVVCPTIRDGERTHLIDRDETLVGRATSCDITIDDPCVSRRHFKLLRRGELFHLLDQGHGGGIWIGDAHLSSTVLIGGEEINVGAFVVFHYDRDE